MFRQGPRTHLALQRQRLSRRRGVPTGAYLPMKCFSLRFSRNAVMPPHWTQSNGDPALPCLPGSEFRPGQGFAPAKRLHGASRAAPLRGAPEGMRRNTDRLCLLADEVLLLALLQESGHTAPLDTVQWVPGPSLPARK